MKKTAFSILILSLLFLGMYNSTQKNNFHYSKKEKGKIAITLYEHEKVFSSFERSNLISLISEYNKNSLYELSIHSVSNTGMMKFEDYSKVWADSIRVGDTRVKNKIAFVFNPVSKCYFFSTNFSNHQIFKDDFLVQLKNEVFDLHFKEGEYYSSVTNLLKFLNEYENYNI